MNCWCGRGFWSQGNAPVQKLRQPDVVHRVCAAAQARGLRRIEPMLTEEELSVYRRGRNTRDNVAKNASPAVYRAWSRIGSAASAALLPEGGESAGIARARFGYLGGGTGGRGTVICPERWFCCVKTKSYALEMLWDSLIVLVGTAVYAVRALLLCRAEQYCTPGASAASRCWSTVCNRVPRRYRQCADQCAAPDFGALFFLGKELYPQDPSFGRLLHRHLRLYPHPAPLPLL